MVSRVGGTPQSRASSFCIGPRAVCGTPPPSPRRYAAVSPWSSGREGHAPRRTLCAVSDPEADFVSVFDLPRAVNMVSAPPPARLSCLLLMVLICSRDADLRSTVSCLPSARAPATGTDLVPHSNLQLDPIPHPPFPATATLPLQCTRSPWLSQEVGSPLVMDA